MSTFNGPELAAEALRRLHESDCAPAGSTRGAHLRQTAAVYATLASIAAHLGADYEDRNQENDRAWNRGLRPTLKVAS